MIEFVSPRRKRQVSTLLTWILSIALILSVVSVGYLATNPPETTDPFTEFYILGPDGEASGYPTNLSVNESGSVIVGISNREHQNQTYTVVVESEEVAINRTVTVGEGETLERRLSFTPETVGRQKVLFLLYKGANADRTSEPYRRLRLWINISPPQSNVRTTSDR